MKIKKLLNTTLTVVGGLAICGKVVDKIKGYRDTHYGTRFMYKGLWRDDFNNLYNSKGEKVGKVTWDDEKGY